MSGIISGLLIGLVVNAIWLILLIGVGRSYGVMRRDSCSRFWRSEKTSRSIIAVVSVIPTSATTKEYKRPATGLGELLAFSYVSKSLYAARRSSSLSSVFTADRFPSEALASSIITIGGSQLNSITELFLECLDLEYEVLNDPPKCVHDRASGRKFETVQRNGEIVVDHGILTRIVNPFKETRRVYVLQGAHTFGTAACGRVLDPEHISKVRSAVSRLDSPNWQAVIRAVIHGGEVLPEVVEARAVRVLGTPYQRQS